MLQLSVCFKLVLIYFGATSSERLWNRTQFSDPINCEGTKISLLDGPKNAINIEPYSGTSWNCLYKWYEGRCHNASEYKIAPIITSGNIRDCNIRNIDKWRNVSKDLYQMCKINYYRHSSVLNFAVLPCFDQGGQYAIKATTWSLGSEEFCYEYERGRCYDSSKFKIAAKCSLLKLEEWNGVLPCFGNFTVEAIGDNHKKKFKLAPCSPYNGPSNLVAWDIGTVCSWSRRAEIESPNCTDWNACARCSGTIDTDAPEEVTTQFEALLGGFIQTNISTTPTSLLDGLENFDDFMANYSIANGQVGSVITLSVSTLAKIEFGKIKSGAHDFQKKAGDSTQLLALNSSISSSSSVASKRKKRSIVILVFVFKRYFFELGKMRPFFDRTVSPATSFWQIGTVTKYEPSATARYLDVKVYDLSGSPVDAEITLIVNMKNDTTVDSVGLPNLFKIYRSWFEPVSRDLVCQRLDVQRALFTSDGCTTEETDGLVSCSCDRTGMFTVVPRIVARIRPDGINVIFYTGLLVGVLLLFFAMLSLISMGSRVESERVRVQINLVVSLLLLHIFVLVETRALDSAVACEVTTFFTHYFLLATALFALMESLTILANLNDRSLRFIKLNRRHVIVSQLLLGWGLPLLVAVLALAAALPSDTYIPSSPLGGYERCWLKPASAALVAGVTVPVATVFAACFAASSLTAFWLFRAKSDASGRDEPRPAAYDVMTVNDVDMDHVRRMLVENALVCLALLLPWILYFMPGIHNLDVTVATMYVTMTFIGAQGICVYVIYVIASRDVRPCWGDRNYPERYSLYWYGPDRQNENSIQLETHAETVE